MSNGTTTTEPPPTVTTPVNPTPTPTSDPAFVPSPLQPAPAAKDPWEEDAFKQEVAAAGFPGSPQTDVAFMAALYKFKGGTAAAAPTQSTGSTPPSTPAAAPVISSIAPSSTAHNVDCTLSITGTGFDSGATVQVGSNSVTPSTPATPTSINVTIPAADISIAGSVPISVKNSDGQISNQQALTLT